MSKTTQAWLIGLAVGIVCAIPVWIFAKGAPLYFWFIPGFAGIFTGYILFNLSGNRKQAEASLEERTRALAFAPPPEGKTALYLVREGFVGKAAGMNLALNGRALPQLKSPRFTRLDIDPGAHTLHASFGGGLTMQTHDAAHTFTAQAGDTIVLKLGMAMGVLRNKATIAVGSVAEVRPTLHRVVMISAANSAN